MLKLCRFPLKTKTHIWPHLIIDEHLSMYGFKRDLTCIFNYIQYITIYHVVLNISFYCFIVFDDPLIESQF